MVSWFPIKRQFLKTALSASTYKATACPTGPAVFTKVIFSATKRFPEIFAVNELNVLSLPLPEKSSNVMIVCSTLSPTNVTSVLFAGNSIFSLYTPFLMYSVIGANGNTLIASMASWMNLKSPVPSLATVNIYLYCCGLEVCPKEVTTNTARNKPTYNFFRNSFIEIILLNKYFFQKCINIFYCRLKPWIEETK